MIQNIYNSNPSGINLGSVRQMLATGSVSASAGNFRQDNVQLTRPVNFGQLPAIQNDNFGGQGTKSPKQQIMDLGRKYNIPYTGDINSYQKRVIKSVIMHKAIQYGVPLPIALGMAGNESGWKMWSDLEKGIPVQGKNIRDGQLKSTDWGVMQINDKANPKAFPRVKYDLEANIDYGLKVLSGRRNKISGSLGLGFGSWDRTIASYNLGHNPNTERGYAIASRYVSGVKKRSLTV